MRLFLCMWLYVALFDQGGMDIDARAGAHTQQNLRFSLDLSAIQE